MPNLEILALFQSERMRFENVDGDVVIAHCITPCGDSVTVKGKEPEGNFHRGETYRFFGQWKEYRNPRTGSTEDQFQFSTAVKSVPFTRAGVVKYLQRAPNVGEKVALGLWESFGSDAVQKLREEPEQCSDGWFSFEKSEEASEYLRGKHRLEACVIDLLGLFEGCNLPKQTIDDCIQKWGNRAAELLKRNPYLLMRFSGIGFLRCDKLYISLGLPPDRLKRQALAAWYAVHQLHQNGDTWSYRDVALAAVKQNCGNARPERALQLAIRSGILKSCWTEGKDGPLHWDGDYGWLADRQKAKNEKRLAENIREAIQDSSFHGIGLHDDTLTEHQSENLVNLFSHPGCLKILGGSPGTGKTYAIVQVAKYWISIFGRDRVALATPTGKAAVRLTEAMHSQQVPLVAKTWHSLLKVESSGGGWQFYYGADRPLPFDVVIGDESSMLDTDIANHCFAARSRGTLFFLVGDVNQLPPVGHGAPLRDMIAAGVPYVELTEVRRNSGTIVEACRQIRETGDVSIFHLPGGSNVDSNFVLMDCSTTDQQIDGMLAVVSEQITDPVWRCQVLTAVNKSGDLNRKKLNKLLQEALNQNEPVKNSPFRMSDKVVCLKNSWSRCLDAVPEAVKNAAGQVYVANGDIGKVTECRPAYMEIELQSPYRLVSMARSTSKREGSKTDSDATEKPDEDSGTGCNWDLAYALSVHKAQGSESPVVIVMLDDGGGARRLCDRAWFYTAISRATELCVCIGKEETAKAMVRRNKIDERRTFLDQLIIQEQ